MHRSKPRAELDIVGPSCSRILQRSLGPEEVIQEQVGAGQQQNQLAIVRIPLAGAFQPFDGGPRLTIFEQLYRRLAFTGGIAQIWCRAIRENRRSEQDLDHQIAS